MRIGNNQSSEDLSALKFTQSIESLRGEISFEKCGNFSALRAIGMLIVPFTLSAFLIISSEGRGLITWFAMILIGMLVYGLLRGKQIIQRTQTRIRRRERLLSPLTVSFLPFIEIEMLTMAILLALICLGIFYAELHYESSIKIHMRKLKSRITRVMDQYFRGFVVLSVLVVVIMIILSGSLRN